MAIYGTLEIPNGIINENLISYTNEHLLKFLPYVLNLDFSDCIHLTGTLDLTNCKSLVSLDVSGTSLNANLGTKPIISILRLGTPTSVSLIKPTVLTGSGINVDHYGNITSIDIIKEDNQTCNAFNIFNKIITTL